MGRAIGIAIAGAVVLLTAPLWRGLEPYGPQRGAGGAAIAALAGPLVLLLFALWQRRAWLSASGALHAVWLAAAFVSFSTVGELWSGSQILLANLSALAVVGLSSFARHREEGRRFDPAAYGARLALGLVLSVATISAARGVYDGVRWWGIHGEASRMAAWAEADATRDLDDYEPASEWAASHVSYGAASCADAPDRDARSIRYSVATPHTSHTYRIGCPGRSGWFYYPD